MSFSKHGLCAILATCTVVSTACSDLGSVLAPSGTTGDLYQATGEVRDDSCLLPDGLGADACLPIAGARVEVLDGPEKGRVAITGPDGKYDLGSLTQKPLVCILTCVRGFTSLSVSKNGWATTSAFTDAQNTWPINLGQAPHVMWGLVEVPDGTSGHVPAAGVRVAITAGPNAGRVVFSNDAGLYRFDNLPTQGAVNLEFSKEGFRTERTWPPVSLTKNQQWAVRLKAQ